MPKIPLPQRGQPIDMSYISELASAINNVAAQVSPSSYKYVTVDTPNTGKQSVKASEARIIAGYVEVANQSTVSSGNEKSFSYSVSGGEFKFAPVVTATPVNVGNTEAGKNVSVILKTVTTSKVEGIVRFNTSGDVSVAVNLIMVGIPN